MLAELRRTIVSGELRPGVQVRQDAIAEQLGVSRVPVREALRILEGEGLVSSQPHRGYFVTELSYEELTEAYRIREILEAEAMTVALPKLTGANIGAMRRTIRAIKKADRHGDLVTLTEANRQFHFALFEPCGLPRLIRMIRQLWDSTDAYRSIYFADSDHRDVVNDEHALIITAAEAGDIETVLKLMATHRKNAVHELREVLANS